MNQADDANAGSQLAAMRRPKTRECPICGNQFVTIGRGGLLLDYLSESGFVSSA